jgi:putative CRISPR-associated protein (TIGR02619 family)
MEKKKVIALVGTSIFEKYLKEKENGNDVYNNLKDKTFVEFKEWEEDAREFQNSIKEWAKERTDASAEIKSLLKIKEELKQDKLPVYLLATDTILSPLAAEIIKEWFKDKEDFEIYFEKEYGKGIIKGLQVRNSKEFEEEGLMNLFERIEEIAEGNPKSIVFNITGGYKAVVPFLTFYAQIYEVPAYYIFEDEEKLIELPKLPLEVDFSLIEDYFIAFEAISPDKIPKNLPSKEKFLKYLNNNPQEAEKIFEKLKQSKLIVTKEVANKKNKTKENKVFLTIYGRLIYKKFFEEKAREYDRLKGTFMELKLFEYLYKKYLNEKDIKVYHSSKFGDFEADIVIENNKEKTIRVIEVKPGNRIPFDDIKEQKIKKLLPRVKEKYPNYHLSFEVYLYRKIEILDILKGKMQDCNQLAKDKMGRNFEIKWYWLKITDNIYDAHQIIKDSDIKLIDLGGYHV